MTNLKNMRVIFTPKADVAVSEIKQQYGLQDITGTEKSFKLFTTIRSFVVEDISEKEMQNRLQKDLEISQQVAQQISLDIINNVIPFVEKIPEEKFKNPDSIEEISKKIWRAPKKEQPEEAKPTAKISDVVGIENNKDTLEQEENPAEIIHEKKSLVKKIQKPIKKVTTERDSKLPKESVPPKKQTSDADKYREQI
jgi:hypothetical protein